MISIIIPVYNTKVEFFKRCIKSISNQSDENYEVIVVDDGSSKQNSDEYKKIIKQNEKFKYFYKKNSGVSSSRNYGVSLSKSEWIMFVDADDWLEKDCIKYFRNNILKGKKYDIYISKPIINYHALDIKDYITNNNCNTGGLEKSEVKRLINSIFIDNYYYKYVDTPWAKVYNRKIFGKFKFDKELKYGEDGLFNFLVYNNFSVYYIDEFTYNYYINEYSVCNSYNPRIIENFNNLFAKYEEYANQEKISLDDFAYNYFGFRQIVNILKKYFRNSHNNQKYKEKVKEFNKFLNSFPYVNFLKNVRLNELGFKKKIIYLIIKFRVYFVLIK